MAFPNASTLAPAYGFTLDNEALSVAAGVLPRNGALLAQYDPSKTAVVDYVPKLYTSVEQVGYELGWGFPAHRMAMNWFLYGAAVPMWIMPIPEDGGATQRVVEETVTVTTALAGTVSMYIGDDLYETAVAAGATDAAIATAIAATINAEPNCPFTASAALGVVTLTSKASGTYANDYLIEYNYESTEAFPDGVTIANTSDTAGTVAPDVDDALAAMGSGSESNSEYWTDCVTSNGFLQATLTACSTWNGLGDQPVGNYAPDVMRPTRFLCVDTTAGDAGYAAMKAITDVNTYDRTNCCVGAPGHKRHPVEIASEIQGACASVAQGHPHQSYVGIPLQGHGSTAFTDRWTRNGTTRDTAIKAGIATTRVIDGTLVIDGLVTMYRPVDIAPANNLYRSYRNIAITQNLSNFHRQVWEPAKNKTIVADTALVDPSEKLYCMDIDGAKDLNNKWADECEGKAWIYNAQFTKDTQSVVIRDLSNGFDHVLKVIYSAEGVVSNTTVIGDISLSALAG